jgi:peptidoglycan/LPS O-acetylase OafA/YrhL
MEWSILAAIRFYLAFLVICSHLRWFLPANELILSFGQPDAKAAVIGFLVISGYSIASSVKKSTKGFYKRRIMRLYPIYFASLIFIFVPFWITQTNVIQTINHSFNAPNPLLIVGNLFFLQNVLIPSISANPVIWTLSLEVILYLFAPFISQKVNDRNLLIFIVFSAICFVLSGYFNLPHFAKLLGGLNIILLGWSWCLGFYYYRNKHLFSAKILLIMIGVLSLALYGSPLRIIPYLAVAYALILAPKMKLPRILEKIFDFAGNISYPLYLVHVPSLIIANSILGWKSWFSLLSFSIVISIIFYYSLDFYTKNRQKIVKSV